MRVNCSNFINFITVKSALGIVTCKFVKKVFTSIALIANFRLVRMGFLEVLLKQCIVRKGFEGLRGCNYRCWFSWSLRRFRRKGLDMLTNVVFATRQRTIELISPAFWKNLARLFFRRLFEKDPLVASKKDKYN